MPNLQLAISNFQIIGALWSDGYEGAEYDWPHGFRHLLDQQIRFDIVDIDAESNMGDAYVQHFKPATPNDTTCSECGSNTFFATQRMIGETTVVVRINGGKATFSHNPTPDGLIDTADFHADEPVGPFHCSNCGKKLTPKKPSKGTKPC